MIATFGGTVTQTFGPGGSASSVSLLVGTAIGGSFASMVTGALGMGNVSSQIKIVTTLACIGICIGAVAKTLGTLGISW